MNFELEISTGREPSTFYVTDNDSWIGKVIAEKIRAELGAVPLDLERDLPILLRAAKEASSKSPMVTDDRVSYQDGKAVMQFPQGYYISARIAERQPTNL